MELTKAQHRAIRKLAEAMESMESLESQFLAAQKVFQNASEKFAEEFAAEKSPFTAEVDGQYLAVQPDAARLLTKIAPPVLIDPKEPA